MMFKVGKTLQTKESEGEKNRLKTVVQETCSKQDGIEN